LNHCHELNIVSKHLVACRPPGKILKRCCWEKLDYLAKGIPLSSAKVVDDRKLLQAGDQSKARRLGGFSHEPTLRIEFDHMLCPNPVFTTSCQEIRPSNFRLFQEPKFNSESK
jgi:hypothetical protein